MKKYVEQNIAKIKELLSTQPVNNSKNQEIYINQLQKSIAQCKKSRDKVIVEFKKRLDDFNSIKENAEIVELKDKMDNLKVQIKMSNPINLPANILNIDKSLYLISKYYKSDLSSLNENIANILNGFKQAGVELNADDFSYTPYVKRYMEAYFQNETSSKFEEIYSECPNLVTHIKICLHYLYNLNVKKIDKYIENQRKEIKSYDDNVNDYQNLKMRRDQLIIYDSALNIKQFRDKELKVSDYSDEKMTKLVLQFGDEKSVEEYILKFYYTIEEYKKYLHYKYLIDDVKKIYAEKDKYKNATKNKLKEIGKSEKNLFKLSKSRADKDLEIETCITELNTLYQELDDIIFNEKVSTLKEDDNIIDILNLALSNYKYLVKCFQEKGIDQTQYDQEIEELFEFILSPYNTLINNLNFTQEHEFSNIISGKYHLLGLKISADLINEGNLESLLASSKVLINYEAFKKTKLNLEVIDSYCRIQEIVSKL